MSPRKYDAPRRADQAAATRAAIIDAAARLFAERGYGATTMAAIAAEARVAAKSVYSLGDKSELLTLSLDRAIVGDDEPVALVDRPELQAVMTAANGADMARLVAALGAPMLLRLYPLYRAFEQAASVDPQLATKWQEYQERRRQDVRRVVESVQVVAPLRPGLDSERAIDTLWALVGWHPVALLVEQRGWGLEELQHWIGDVFVALLLDQTEGSRQGTDGRPRSGPVPTP